MYIVSNLVWTEGKVILIAQLVSAVIGYYFFAPLLYVTGISLGLSFYFFRNPRRTCSQALQNPSLIVCPADGRVVEIEPYSEPGLEQFVTKVSIFLSPLDVHVNWIPIAGKIIKVTYRPGKFMMALVPKSSELNERNEIMLTDSYNRSLIVRQIAGTIARTVVCWVKQQDHVLQGQKYGMIKFGSRVDILIPRNVTLFVTVGQHVYGGHTVLGKWNA